MLLLLLLLLLLCRGTTQYVLLTTILIYIVNCDIQKHDSSSLDTRLEIFIFSAKIQDIHDI